ncbi:hypothetical protein TorRG33x02_152850, partial [Trema orientale]
REIGDGVNNSNSIPSCAAAGSAAAAASTASSSHGSGPHHGDYTNGSEKCHRHCRNVLPVHRCLAGRAAQPAGLV